MSALLVILLLQVLGVLVILAEVVVPSAGVLTVAAVVLMGYSIYHAFTAVGMRAGIVTIAADIVLVPIALIAGMKLLARSPLALRKALAGSDGGRAQREDLVSFVGKTGVARTILRPAGIAEIDGRRVDVVTHGDFIESGTPVTVVAVEANQVIVARSVAPTENTLTEGRNA